LTAIQERAGCTDLWYRQSQLYVSGSVIFFNDSCLYFNSNLGPRVPKGLIKAM